MKVCKQCHHAMVGAVKPFKLHDSSMSNIYKVFEHLLLLWIGIWMHPHTLAIADVHPQCCRVDWKLMWLRHANNGTTLYDWGCKTFQTGSHIHFIHVHVHGVWAPSAVVDRNMDATLTISDIHPQCCRVAWKLMSWRRANNATTLYDWGCKSYHTGSHIHVIHIQGVWVPSAVVDWHMNAPTHPCHSRCSSPM